MIATTGEQKQSTPPYGQSFQSMVALAHKRSAAEPIARPDAQGAFGHSFLPFVFPVVIDANALRDELLRIAERNQRTILANAGNSGVLRLFCAQHVVEEVEEHLCEWAAQKQLSPNDVRQVWDGTYLPLLRCVDVPNGLTTSDEAERLAVLADPQSKFGDPDDVPTATLALLLGAPLLSRDRNPLRSVYGSGFDHVQHGKWLDRVRAGGDLAPLGSFLQGMRMLTVGVGVGGYEGLKALARRVSWPWLLLGGLVSAGTLNLLVPTDTKRHAQSALGTGLVAARSALEVTELHTTARRHFESLSPNQPAWANVVAQRDADAALARACLHFLARSPRSDLSAAELSQQLSFHLESPHGETKVRKTLRELPCVDQPYQGRFQLGRALVTAEQTDHP